MMRTIPFVSLALALLFIFAAWHWRKNFRIQPYVHWFIFLHLAAVGLHQFEEYGWPGGFRDIFADTFGDESVAAFVPSTLKLELVNAFLFLPVFALIGWIGIRIKWLGLALLFTNFANGFFHLVTTVTQFMYIPGVITGTLLYMPLALFAARHAIQNNDVDAPQLLLAFALGTLTSFLPFLHVRAMFGLS